MECSVLKVKFDHQHGPGAVPRWGPSEILGFLGALGVVLWGWGTRSKSWKHEFAITVDPIFPASGQFFGRVLRLIGVPRPYKGPKIENDK